jgi:hypothetical protein
MACALCCGAFCAAAAGSDEAPFTARATLIAVIGGELFQGEVEGGVDGRGTLSMHAPRDHRRRCAGSFDAPLVGDGDGALTCGDGPRIAFRFRKLGLFRGHGIGAGPPGAVALTFVYGLNAEEATPYLVLPAGKRLTHRDLELDLIDE